MRATLPAELQERNQTIPAELRELPQWVVWDNLDGRKVPKGKTNDPKTWRPFNEIAHKERIGFVFSPEDHYTGVDLDKCIVDGQVAPWALQILEKFKGCSYAEISPSGTGIHLITIAKKPPGSPCNNRKGVECYEHERYFAKTGKVIPGYEHINQGQQAVDWLCETHLGRQAPKAESRNFAHGALVTRAKDYLRRITPPSEGSRNDTMFRTAGHLLAMEGQNSERLSESEVFGVLADWNRKSSNPLDEPELMKCISSAAVNGTPREEKPPVERQADSKTKQQANEAKSESSPLIQPISASQLVKDYPDLRPPVIKGIARRGETINLVAAAKVGKSFLAGYLAWCIATGRPWLSHEVEQGRVLIIDNELHPETLANRIDAIANGMMIDESERDSIDFITLRGLGVDIHDLGSRLDIKPETYSLVILDALYRFLPEGTSENDNAQMMAIYNRLDAYAMAWDCAICVVHHASKGTQEDKAITDVGSGAGSISRAADTHIVIRPHEQDGLCVLEGATRSFKRPEAVSIRYEYPLWHAVAVDAQVRTSKGRGDVRQSKNDQETDQAVRNAIQGRWRSVSELRSKTGFGADRIVRSLRRIGASSKKMKSKSTGKSCERFSLPDEQKSGEVV